MSARRSQLATLAALCALAASCTVQIAGNDREARIRGIVTGSGAAVANATVTARISDTRLVTATTDTTGTYRLALDDVPDRIVLSVTANGLMPTRALVEYRGGVFHYLTDLPMQVGTRLAPGAETTLALGGRMYRIKVPAGAVAAGGTVEVAVFPPEGGPGAMETTEAADQRLQSLGLFFLRPLDAAGKPSTFTLTGSSAVSFTISNDVPQLTDGQMMKIYGMGEDGQWAPSSTAGTTGLEIAASQTGYFMAGRGYKVACVTGTFSAPTRACTGERVRVTSNDNIYTQDTTGTGGAFCVEGPQGRTAILSLGAKTQQIAFTANKPASCHVNPADCTSMGTIVVADTDCTASTCTRSQVDDPSSSTGCNTK